MDAAPEVAAALTLMLRRGFRIDLYKQLTAGIHASLDVSTYPVLSAVEQLGPASASAIASRIGLDRSVVSRRARALVDGGLLVSTTNPEDARQLTLDLTPAGAEAMRATSLRLEGIISRQMHGWSTADQKRFANLLHTFASGAALGAHEPLSD